MKLIALLVLVVGCGVDRVALEDVDAAQWESDSGFVDVVEPEPDTGVGHDAGMQTTKPPKVRQDASESPDAGSDAALADASEDAAEDAATADTGAPDAGHDAGEQDTGVPWGSCYGTDVCTGSQYGYFCGSGAPNPAVCVGQGSSCGTGGGGECLQWPGLGLRCYRPCG